MKKMLAESWLVLVLGVLFAAMLAAAQTSLSPAIEQNQQKALQEAIGEVVPGATKVEPVTVTGYDRAVFACFDAQGQRAGWAIDAVGIGFADKIRLVVGLSPDTATVTGLKVIENVETPGLGNKIADAEWSRQYAGLKSDTEMVVRKNRADHAKSEIQAITGATISSNAVTHIVNEALARVRPELLRMAGS